MRRYAITDRGLDELERLKAVMQPKLKEAITVLKDILDDLDTDEDNDTATANAEDSPDGDGTQ